MVPNIDTQSKDLLAPVEKISPKELLMAIIRRWKWIALSLTCCLGLAVFYLAWKSYTYTREAQLEIKDDSQNGSTSSALSMFSDLGFANATNNLYNEMAYFDSPDLMAQVVERLGLQTNYYMRKGLRSMVLYGSNLPVTVTFETLPQNISGMFKMKIDENDQIFLSHFKVKKDKVDFDSKRPVQFGQTVVTPLGKIKIEKTPFYGKDKEEEDDKGYKITVARSSLHGAVETWMDKLSVEELRKEASVVNLSVYDGSTRRAEDVLNTVIQVYNEDWIKNKNEIALASSDFIDSRLAALSGELDAVNSNLADFKTNNQITYLFQGTQMNLAEDQTVRANLLQLNTELQMAKYLKDYIEKDYSASRALPTNIGVNSVVLEEQIAAHNRMVLNRNSALASSSEASPVVMSLNSQIEDSKNAILTSIDTRIKNLSIEIANVNKEKLSVDNKLNSHAYLQQHISDIERERNVKASLYTYLLQKKEENQLNQAFTAYNTRIITRPYGDSEPDSPKTPTVMMLAFIMGLAIPIGIIYVREVSDTKVRGKEDLKGLSIPFLGEIPMVNRNKFDDKDHMVVVESGNRNIVNEAYRVVRTNLNFMLDSDEKCPVVMLTSFNPGSGKSFITVNLALALAIRGKKVLVIDGDMRRNSASAFIGKPDNGLAQCLLGKCNASDVIVKGQLNENLDILSGGTTPPNPTELLENGRLKPIIEKLRDEYDVIFIDCPPIQMIADGRIFATVCTNTIFVLRAGIFEKGLLYELQDVYRSKEYKKMCLLLNGTEGRGSYGGYGAGKNYYAQK